MKPNQFDWDLHCSRSSFATIRDLSPELSQRRLPSGFSPDRKFYYISSFDDEVLTSDIEELKDYLSKLGDRFHSLRDNDYMQQYLVHVDFSQICSMLQNLEGIGNDYDLPDQVLQSRKYRQNEVK